MSASSASPCGKRLELSVTGGACLYLAGVISAIKLNKATVLSFDINEQQK